MEACDDADDDDDLPEILPVQSMYIVLAFRK